MIRPKPGLCKGPCGLMDKALVFRTKDCRFESCQGQVLPASRLHFAGIRADICDLVSSPQEVGK